MPVLIAAVLLLGLAVGSFLNVVIHRVPAGMSLSRPGSQCPACAHTIRARHNVPVLGWLILRGRCADCDAPISARYPLVEFGTTVLFVATAVELAGLHLLAALPAYLVFVCALITLAAIDLDVARVPNAILYPSYAAVLLLLGGAAAVEGSWQPLLRAALGSVVLFALFLAVALGRPGELGFGDVKLAALIGAALGFLSWPAVAIGLFAALVIGGLAGAALLVARRAQAESRLPFAPALAAGALLALFAAPVASAALTHLAPLS